MQSLLEQQQSNQIRLSDYRDKLSPAQRIRARVAGQIKEYCDKLGLNIPQTAVAIRIAVMQLDHGRSPEDSYRTGANAAYYIAVTSANEKPRGTRTRSIIRPH